MKSDHSGYYWLIYEWSNLVSGCWFCNNKKSNFFPLLDEEVRVHEPLEDRREWRADSESFLSETPLLLHPAIDDPDEYLTVGDDGKMIEKNGSSRGKATIALCGLNSDGLVILRKKLIYGFRKRLWAIAFSIRQEIKEKSIVKQNLLKTIKDRFETDFSILSSSRRSDEEFSFVGKCICRNFRAFYIEDLPDKGSRKILLKAYEIFSKQMTII